MVLGVDWLSTLGPILWDFAKLTMKFQYHHKEVLLQGLIPATSNWEVEDGLPTKEGAKHKGIWLQLMGDGVPQIQRLPHSAIAELLEGYQEVFREPTGLPPSRTCDHRIQLQGV
jgi:hypothetical protein